MFLGCGLSVAAGIYLTKELRSYVLCPSTLGLLPSLADLLITVLRLGHD